MWSLTPMRSIVPRRTSSGARTASQKLVLKPSTTPSIPFILQTRKNREHREALPSLNIDLVRKEIPVTSRRAYFDNAGTGLTPINVITSIHEYLTDWRDYGENCEEWFR